MASGEGIPVTLGGWSSRSPPPISPLGSLLRCSRAQCPLLFHLGRATQQSTGPGLPRGLAGQLEAGWARSGHQLTSPLPAPTPQASRDQTALSWPQTDSTINSKYVEGGGREKRINIYMIRTIIIKSALFQRTSLARIHCSAVGSVRVRVRGCPGLTVKGGDCSVLPATVDSGAPFPTLLPQRPNSGKPTPS